MPAIAPLHSIYYPETTKQLLDALSLERVADLVKKHLTHSYAKAIMFHHPDGHNLDPVEIQKKCNFLMWHLVDELLTIDPVQLHDRAIGLYLANAYDTRGWFDEFRAAYNEYKRTNKHSIMSSLLFPYIGNPQKLIDIGCGDGNLIHHMAEYIPGVEIAGCDVLDWRSQKTKSNKDFKFYEVDINKNIPDDLYKRYDTGMLCSVIHHASGTEEEAIWFLKQARKVISKRLVILEDIYFEASNFEEDSKWRDMLIERRNENGLFDMFCQLTEEEQKAFLITIDTLGNCCSFDILDMDLQHGFHPVKAWQRILEASGWKLIDFEVMGFVPTMFNRTSKGIFVCEPME